MIIRRNEIHKLDLDGKVVGVTSGCFDLLHFYHLRYLEKCKAQCDFLIVGVDSDTLVNRNKNKVPMIPEHHRIAMVDALKCVDAVFQMDEIKNIEDFYPIANKVFKNSDTIYGTKVEINNSLTAELVIVPDIEEVYSTSELINKIRKENT
ncbi:MAG: adenylyltransferase/cytidyltransferase family protein [Bacteroides sp.]|nr:adenylyltransferase/cytidyltransferase family protein [Bacteroides sp.]